jgi:alkylation response protein AidB-like acyl-CoA dehydrogenase
MTSEFAELHDEVRAAARQLLATLTPPDAVPWHSAASSGWLGLEVAEELGGAGVSFAEVCLICEELGRAGVGGPYLGAVVLGAGLLNALAPGDVRDGLLQQLAEGMSVPVAVLSASDANAEFLLTKNGTELSLSGSASFVPDATYVTDTSYATAANGYGPLLVPSTGPDGTPVVAVIDGSAAGVTVTDRPVLDLARRLADVTLDGVAVGPASVLSYGADAAAAVRGLGDRAAVAVACDSLGVAVAMLDITVEYVKVREQFGRPIGSFQAVKHACADMLVQITVGRELLQQAIDAVTQDAPTAGAAVSMAKSFTCSAAVAVAGKAMQLHGGMGYTWESGIHLAVKRAALNRSMFGSPSAHRRRLARRYLDAET